MGLAAVTLDAGGTLIDVAEPVGVTYARVAARYGIALDAAEAERRFREAFAAAPPLAFPGVNPARLARHERDWWCAIVQHAFGSDSASSRFDDCFAALFEHYGRPDAWRVFPDVREALGHLRETGLRLAVVSNFDRRLVGLLDGLGLASLIDLTVYSSAAGAAKPDAAVFHAALARLEARPDEVLHAGDGVLTDVEGARRAGLRAVLVDRHRRLPRLSPEVSRIETLTELPALVLGND